MQSGQYVAALIQQRLKGKSLIPFRYFERGNLAVIGRNAAVVDLGFIKFSGFSLPRLGVCPHLLSN